MKNSGIMKTETISRRGFLKKTGLIGAGLATTLISEQAKASNGFAKQLFHNVREPKIISFRNLHTGEIFSGAYRVGDQYINESFQQISGVLRDHRTGDKHKIDPELVEYVHMLKVRANSDNDFEILSGYRSPKTNAMLRRRTSGVAKQSLHMQGKAVDLRLAGYNIKRLRQDAQNLKLGGVGYYSDSGFIHLDTGPVRYW